MISHLAFGFNEGRTIRGKSTGLVKNPMKNVFRSVSLFLESHVHANWETAHARNFGEVNYCGGPYFFTNEFGLPKEQKFGYIRMLRNTREF